MSIMGDRTSWLAAYTLARRELTSFVRQRNRVFGALAQPLMFWAILGGGLSGSFAPSFARELGYVEYFFPGTVVLVLLFTAIFATISVVEDRNAGFMQSVLVAPVPRAAIVMGKLIGTAVLAVGQALFVLMLAPLAGIALSPVSLLLAIPLLFTIAFALGGLGFAIAWRMETTQGFHAIMTAFLMPLWIVSGAVFPADGATPWLAWLVRLNPLSYGLAAFRRVLYVDRPELLGDIPDLVPCLVVLALFTAAMVFESIRVARTHTVGAGV